MRVSPERYKRNYKRTTIFVLLSLLFIINNLIIFDCQPSHHVSKKMSHTSINQIDFSSLLTHLVKMTLSIAMPGEKSCV